jgi:hypothetical protein
VAFPAASTVGAGRCPAAICELSSDWIVVSLTVVAKVLGVIVIRTENRPAPMFWFVLVPMYELFTVLYSLLSQVAEPFRACW